MSKYRQIGFSYLIELKTLWEKEKLLITSNISFSLNVFKSCLLLMHQNEYLWSKGLKKEIQIFPGKQLQMTNLYCYESAGGI